MENISSEAFSFKNCRVLYRRTFGKKLAFVSVLTTDGQEITVKVNQPDYIKNTIIGQFYNITGHVKVGRLDKMDHICDYMEIADGDNLNFDVDIGLIRKFAQENIKNKSEREKALCKAFIKFGKCHITGCNFRHFMNEGDEERLKHFEMTKLEALHRVHEGDPHQADSKMKKLHRNKLFAEFLVETYGLDYLRDGYLLDIAGGKGMVSFHLLTGYAIRCIVVDPRGINLPKKQREIMRDNCLSIEERRSFFDDSFDPELIKNAKLIFGMHPDEATVSIVEMALKFNKKFAVVPCCVFPTKFSNRVLNSGEPVVDYTHLIAYILEMLRKENVDGVKETFLKIEGRNKVIYKV